MSARWLPHPHPWVIAHRGASGLFPEHTLPGYALAIEQGADVIEPDLVASADGVLYARHDLGLARSTDIAVRSEFAGRRRQGPDGVWDWWVEDFHSSELDRLRAIQPWPQRPHDRDGIYRLPRFSELIELCLSERRRRERPLLLYPEIKEPAHFRAAGIDIVACAIDALRAAGISGRDAPLLLQCFDRDCLLELRAATGLRSTLLDTGLPELDGAEVDAYGLAKSALMGPDGAAFIAAAHARGRLVHAWTFRDDQPLPGIEPVEECIAAFRAGIDGLFSDFPATARRAREQWRASHEARR